MEIDLTNQRLVFLPEGNSNRGHTHCKRKPDIEGCGTPTRLLCTGCQGISGSAYRRDYEANVTYWMPLQEMWEFTTLPGGLSLEEIFICGKAPMDV